MKKQIIEIMLSVLAFSSIGYGVFQIHPPSAYICVGVLLWADILIQDLKEAKK